MFDLQEPGLLLRVSETGLRTWYFRYGFPDGRQPRFKLGTYQAAPGADAPERARHARILDEG